MSKPLAELRTRDESPDLTLEETVKSIDNISGARVPCIRDGKTNLSLQEAVIPSAEELLCTRDELLDSSFEQHRSIEPELENQS